MKDDIVVQLNTLHEKIKEETSSLQASATEERRKTASNRTISWQHETGWNDWSKEVSIGVQSTVRDE